MRSFEPYAGVGLGLFFTKISTEGMSSSSTDVGLNAQLGLRYRFNTNVAFFSEWKFNYANISQPDWLGVNGINVSADYTAHNVIFGVGYHF